ncbi:hypothetical protein J2T10_004172 [Paenarthrobacter nicotinovorans]|uniref:Immunity protein 8 of polymorphic toxin system n=1 Tax=Paenarthrobacter nicotinovorans TaxID=29320 RepID=A0ABT9TS55_PAENI|nr:Imm8 family immunity protein [Paenarthrobacter nicotinovorans]MDQ0104497.1 hypothetical protein [Paenarthrobacter nicotinovorans]
MKPVIKYFYSSDVDVDSYESTDPANDGVFLRMIIGDDQGRGEESFDVIVCTVKWLESQVKIEGPIFSRAYLLMPEVDLPAAMTFLRRAISKIQGATWEAVANEIAKFSIWEFDNYVPYHEPKS